MRSEVSPRVWPSYSDLARSVGVRLTSFKRWPATRRFREDTRRIGNEVKVPPEAAVDILMEAGVALEAAERQVAEIIQRRSEGIPALANEAPLAGLARSSIGAPEGSVLQRVFYGSCPASSTGEPDVNRLARLHERFAGRQVPIEEYLRGPRD